MSRATPRHHRFLATIAVTMLLAAGVSAQTNEPTPPPLPPIPPANHDSAADQPAPQQAAAAPQQPADSQTDTSLPPLPLGHDGIVQVQSQLIALGFDPGGADGVAGPATLSAVQQYNESRGGIGRVPVDGRLLARLQQDTGPRLTPEQVAARTHPHYQAAPAGYGQPNPAAILQQFQSTIGALINGGGY
jgi:peptidoglycan hydrolase-like protein with peptidoglycan-binding domain